MKILLLIISLMQYMAGSNISNKTAHYITKESSQKLNESIPLLRNISNQLKPNQLTFNNTLHFGINDFPDIKKTMILYGKISKNYLSLNFSMADHLDQLNNFNKDIVRLDNVKTHFINIVISLINNILPSIPEQDVEISNTNESSFLMRWFKPDNPDKITLSVTHKYHSTQITFSCRLSKEPKTIIVPSFNPNEQEEENESEPLLIKKEK